MPWLPWSSAAVLAGGVVLCWGPPWAGVCLVAISVIGAIGSKAVTIEEAKRGRGAHADRGVH